MLSKMTVKDLRVVYGRMFPFCELPKRILKTDLINMISEGIEQAHVQALIHADMRRGTEQRRAFERTYGALATEIAKDEGSSMVLPTHIRIAEDTIIAQLHAEAIAMDSVYTCQLCKETVKVTDQASHMDGHPTEEEIYAQEETYTIEIEGTQPVILRGAAAVVMNAHEKAIKRWNPTMARDEWGMVKLTPKQRKRLRKGTHKRAKRAGLYV